MEKIGKKLNKLSISKPSVPPAEEFAEPWRKMKWDEKDKLEQKLRNFKVSNPDVQQVRILVVGPVGAGKSSFITSVNNVFQGRITSEALVDTASGKSFTKVYKSHYIDGENGRPLAFLFNDIMGLEAETGSGAQEEDVIKALKGCVQEGYRFNPQSPVAMDDQRYKSNPKLKDQIFCLVNVLPADTISIMDAKLFQKMRRIREKTTELYLPQVIIMTKPDEVCPLVKSNLQNVYTSKRIKDKMQECSNLLGVPMNHIFPVKNYHEEIDTDNDTDVLILKALDQIVNIANDSLRKKRSDSSDKCEESVLRYEGYPAYTQVTQMAPGGPPPVKKKPFVDPLLRRKDSASAESKSSEVVAEWLTNAQLQIYTPIFLTAEYDLQTISMIDAEDLAAIGVEKNIERQKLLSEIRKLNIPDWTPKEKPTSVEKWLSLIGLSQYNKTLVQNGYDDINFISDITLEDLQEIGITKLGHQKKLLLAINSLGELTKKDLLKNQIDGHTGSKETTAAKPPPPPLPGGNIKHNSPCPKSQGVDTQPVQTFASPEKSGSAERPFSSTTPTHANLKSASPQTNSRVRPVSLSSLPSEGTAENEEKGPINLPRSRISLPLDKSINYGALNQAIQMNPSMNIGGVNNSQVTTQSDREGRLSECDPQSTQTGGSVRELAAKLQQFKLGDGAGGTGKSYLQRSPRVQDNTALRMVSKTPKALENSAVANVQETLQTKNVSDLIMAYQRDESNSNSRPTLEDSDSPTQGVVRRLKPTSITKRLPAPEPNTAQETLKFHNQPH